MPIGKSYHLLVSIIISALYNDRWDAKHIICPNMLFKALVSWFFSPNLLCALRLTISIAPVCLICPLFGVFHPGSFLVIVTFILFLRFTCLQDFWFSLECLSPLLGVKVGKVCVALCHSLEPPLATVLHGFQATVFLPHWRLGHRAALPERDDAQMAWHPRLCSVWRADGLDSNTSVLKSVQSCGPVNTGERVH